MKKKMFHFAPPQIFVNAKVLRNQLTHAELILWGYLKQKPFGFKFRRQHPLNDYIADFFSYKLNLVIEVDGEIHELPEVKERDNAKENWLTENAYSILRFTNYQVEKEFEKVIQEIENRIKLIISAVP